MEWNVDPIFINFGFFELRYYSLLYVIGFIIGYRVQYRIMKHENRPLVWADKIFIYGAVATIVGARLGHCIFYDWSYYSQHILEIFIPFHNGKFTGYTGLASHGAAIAIPLAMWIYGRRVTHLGFFWGMDRIVVGVAAVAICIRCGNLMNSEIVGSITNVPWGVHFTRVDGDNPVLRHPAQIYEALYYAFTFGVLSYMYWKRRSGERPGLLFGTFLMMIFTGRFIIEFVKEVQEPWEEDMVLKMGQLLSIPLIIIGVGLMIYALRRPPRPSYAPLPAPSSASGASASGGGSTSTSGKRGASKGGSQGSATNQSGGGESESGDGKEESGKKVKKRSKRVRY